MLQKIQKRGYILDEKIIDSIYQCYQSDQAKPDAKRRSGSFTYQQNEVLEVLKVQMQILERELDRKLQVQIGHVSGKKQLPFWDSIDGI